MSTRLRVEPRKKGPCVDVSTFCQDQVTKDVKDIASLNGSLLTCSSAAWIRLVMEVFR